MSQTKERRAQLLIRAFEDAVIDVKDWAPSSAVEWYAARERRENARSALYRTLTHGAFTTEQGKES